MGVTPTPVPLEFAAFIAGAFLSLSSSWLLVSRLERLGGRASISEALLGFVVALAADSPEITSAVTAVVHGERTVGTGVVMGSNVFNLAALLGLAAAVAGWIGLHRRVVVLSGSVSLWIAAVGMLVVSGVISPAIGIVLSMVVLGPYVALLASEGQVMSRISMPRRWKGWVRAALYEEEAELFDAIRPSRGRSVDLWAAIGALALVIAASIVMERSGSSLGDHYGLSGVVVGALLLAAVTSLPNAVGAVYLASKGRGAAALSTAMNSNTLNTVIGLLVLGAATGIERPGAPDLLEAAWYLGLTAGILALAYGARGLKRGHGLAIVAVYLVFVAVLVVI